MKAAGLGSGHVVILGLLSMWALDKRSIDQNLCFMARQKHSLNTWKRTTPAVQIEDIQALTVYWRTPAMTWSKGNVV